MTYLFDMACVKSLKQEGALAMEYLKKAIEQDKQYINKAKADSDLDNIRIFEEFRLLID